MGRCAEYTNIKQNKAGDVTHGECNGLLINLSQQQPSVEISTSYLLNHGGLAPRLVNLDSNVENVKNEHKVVNNHDFTHNGLLVKGNFHDIQNNDNYGLQTIGGLMLI